MPLTKTLLRHSISVTLIPLLLCGMNGCGAFGKRAPRYIPGSGRIVLIEEGAPAPFTGYLVDETYMEEAFRKMGGEKP